MQLHSTVDRFLPRGWSQVSPKSHLQAPSSSHSIIHSGPHSFRKNEKWVPTPLPRLQQTTPRGHPAVPPQKPRRNAEDTQRSSEGARAATTLRVPGGRGKRAPEDGKGGTGDPRGTGRQPSGRTEFPSRANPLPQLPCLASSPALTSLLSVLPDAQPRVPSLAPAWTSQPSRTPRSRRELGLPGRHSPGPPSSRTRPVLRLQLRTRLSPPPPRACQPAARPRAGAQAPGGRARARPRPRSPSPARARARRPSSAILAEDKLASIVATSLFLQKP